MLQAARVPLSDLITRLRRTPLRDWSTLEFPVAEAAVLYMVAFLFSASLGVVRQVLFNAQFGLSEAAGAFYVAFRLPETIGMLISGGALTNALVPIILRVEQRAGLAAAQRLISVTLTFLLAVITPLAGLAALLAPQFVQYILAPGLDPATQALAAQLSRLMLLEILLVVSEAALVALLVSRGQLLLPALAIMLRNVSLIGGIVVAILVPGVGIYGPTIGAILDGVLQLAIIVPGLRARRYRPALIWAPWDRDLGAVLRLLGPNALSSVVNYAGGIADISFASMAGRAAAVGALHNANLLIGFPVRLLGMAIGQGALPQLALYGMRGDYAAMRRIVWQALLVACSGAVLAAVALIALGRPVIRLAFERGAFDAAAGDLTYSLLAMFAVGLPFYVATEVLARALIARLDTRTPLLGNVIQLVLRIAIMASFFADLGPLVVPLAFVISSAVETLLLAFVFWRVRE